MEKRYTLPELQGTSKQIEWANHIRSDFMEHWDSQGVDVQNVLLEQTKAEFWISNRHSMTAMVFLKEQLRTGAIYPENYHKPGMVIIEQELGLISVAYQKDNDFIEVVKQCRLRWNKDKMRWERFLSDATGSFKDRAAELGCLLFQKGFAIEIAENEVRRMILRGEYKEEFSSCIGAKKTNGDFIIKWNDKNDALYNDAKQIKGAVWDKNLGSMIIHVSQYKSVEDLAEKYNLAYTSAAKTKIRNYKQEINEIRKKQGKI